MSSLALDTVNGDEDNEDRPGDDHCGEYEYGESIMSIPEFIPYLASKHIQVSSGPVTVVPIALMIRRTHAVGFESIVYN